MLVAPLASLAIFVAPRRGRLNRKSLLMLFTRQTKPLPGSARAPGSLVNVVGVVARLTTWVSRPTRKGV